MLGQDSVSTTRSRPRLLISARIFELPNNVWIALAIERG